MYTSSGIPVNALYGFCKTLLKIIKEQPVDHLIAACDGKSTHRKLLWTEYKAHRSETPDELKIQKKLLEIFLKEAEITTQTRRPDIWKNYIANQKTGKK